MASSYQVEVSCMDFEIQGEGMGEGCDYLEDEPFLGQGSTEEPSEDELFLPDQDLSDQSEDRPSRRYKCCMLKSTISIGLLGLGLLGLLCLSIACQINQAYCFLDLKHF